MSHNTPGNWLREGDYFVTWTLSKKIKNWLSNMLAWKQVCKVSGDEWSISFQGASRKRNFFALYTCSWCSGTILKWENECFLWPWPGNFLIACIILKLCSVSCIRANDAKSIVNGKGSIISWNEHMRSVREMVQRISVSWNKVKSKMNDLYIIIEKRWLIVHSLIYSDHSWIWTCYLYY